MMRHYLQSFSFALIWFICNQSKAFEVELKYLPFWKCNEFDKQEAEKYRNEYFTALQVEAINVLDKNLKTVTDYLNIYNQDITQLSRSNPDRLGAVTQRKNFIKTIKAEQSWTTILDFYKNAVFHTHFVANSIRGLFQWSCYYPDDAEKRLLDLLAPLEPYGIVVVSGNRIVQGSRAGEQVAPGSGDYYTIDLDLDIRPLLGINPNDYLNISQGKQKLFEYSRIFQIDALVQRDYFRAQALLSEAKVPMPILDAQVPEGIRSWWIFRPTIKEIVLRQVDSDCKKDQNICLAGCGGREMNACVKSCIDGYVECAKAPIADSEKDFWNGMQFALLDIQKNIVEERDRIKATGIQDIEELLVLPEVRLKVLADPKFEGIDCVVMSEWTERTYKDFQKKMVYVEQGVFSLAGLALTLTGNVPLGYLCFAAAWIEGIPLAITLYQEYQDAQQKYFTAVEGYGLFPRELYTSKMVEFNVALAQTILDGIFTLPQVWILYKAVVNKTISSNILYRLVKLIAGKNPEEAQALTSKVLATLNEAPDQPATKIAEKVVKVLDQEDPLVQALGDAKIPQAVEAAQEPVEQAIAIGKVRANYPNASPFRIVDKSNVADEQLSFSKIRELLDRRTSLPIELPKTLREVPELHIGIVNDDFLQNAETFVRKYHEGNGATYYLVVPKNGPMVYMSEDLWQWLYREYLPFLKPGARPYDITVFRWLSSGDDIIQYGKVRISFPQQTFGIYTTPDLDPTAKLVLSPHDPLFDDFIPEYERYLKDPTYFPAGLKNYPTILESLLESAPKLGDLFEIPKEIFKLIEQLDALP